MTSKNPNRKSFTADTSGSPGNAGKSNPKNSKSVDLPKPKNVGIIVSPPIDAVDILDSLKQPTGNDKQKISAPSAPVPKLNLDDVAQSDDSVKPQDTLKSTLSKAVLYHHFLQHPSPSQILTEPCEQ